VQFYLVRRLLLVPVTIFLLSAFVFAMLRAVPGSVIESKLGDNYTPKQAKALAHQYGFDRPIYEQYASWAGRILQGDLGKSLVSARPVADQFKRRFPVTLELLLLTMMIQVPLGIGLGVISATRQDKPEDYILRVGAILFLAIPNFWLATLVIVLPLLWWNVSLPAGYVDFWVDPMRNLHQMIVPALVAGAAGAAILMRATRSYLLEVLRQDYVRTARAKGLNSRVVVLRHALRNAFIPILTIIGLSFASGFAGSVIMEQIFALPGLGQYIVSSLTLRDYSVIQTFVILFGTAFVLINLLVDLAYGWLDPRVRVRQ
jgi:peptide/nickel transport system permease protein